jgi:hypothetical protein
VAQRSTCGICGKYIGVFEPIVVRVEGETRETSLLRELPAQPPGGTYHRKCVDELPDEGQPAS